MQVLFCPGSGSGFLILVVLCKASGLGRILAVLRTHRWLVPMPGTFSAWIGRSDTGPDEGGREHGARAERETHYLIRS